MFRIVYLQLQYVFVWSLHVHQYKRLPGKKPPPFPASEILVFAKTESASPDNKTEAFSPEARNGFLKIEVDYVIRSTNSRFNFVYKYYLQEGNKSELYQSGRI